MNNRIFWAVLECAMREHGQINPPTTVFGSGDVPFGVQSVGVTTTFNLEQIYQLGQLEIYENIENLPDIEIALEKVLDGYALLYHMCTPTATDSSLVGRASTARTDFAMSVFNETQMGASGTPISEVFCSGLYIGSLTYTFPVEGNCTEALTLVGNDKWWSVANWSLMGHMVTGSGTPTEPLVSAGGVQRRENVLMSACRWPTELPGISASGTNDGFEDEGVDAARIQTVTVSTDFGRTDLYELGMRRPYYKYIDWPIEVTCAIELIGTKGDFINALSSAASNLSNQYIYIETDDGTKVNLGTKNKLASVDFGGADAGGGSNATLSYNYSNWNILKVTHSRDPANLT